jgi:hypothetical protein
MTKLITPFCNFVNAPKKLKTIATLHKLKPKKEPLTPTDQTTDTTQRTRTHAFKISNTTNTIYRENCVSSWVQTYYLDNSLLISGYQMDEISVQGGLIEFFKHDM